MVEVTLLETVVVCLHDRGSSTRGWVFGHGLDNSRKCTHCNRINTLFTDVRNCKANLPVLLELLICLVLLDHLLHMTNTLGTSADEIVTLSKFYYDSLIQKMHSVSTSDMATLAHPGISYLASSSPSFWISDCGASTDMTGKFTVFFTFHTSYASYIVFTDGSFNYTTGTINFTSSLPLTNINYIHMFFLILYLWVVWPKIFCVLSLSSFIMYYSWLSNEKMIGGGMSKMIYIIFKVVINLKWVLLLWHVVSLRSSDTYV